MANPKARPLQYAVLWVATSDTLYIGMDADEATEASIRGTCYGSGATREEALTEARCRAFVARRAWARTRHLWVDAGDEPTPARRGDPSRERIERMCAEIRARKGAS